MTLSTETSAADKIVLGDFSPIPPDPEPANLEPLWCSDCGRMQTIEIVEKFYAGRVGWCYGCGERKFIPYERTNSEAA